jgi:hypothetical protein
MRNTQPDVLLLALLSHCQREAAMEPSAFASALPAAIAPGAYFAHLTGQLSSEDRRSVALVALVYMRRAHLAGVAVTARSAHRVLAACTFASAKYLLDRPYDCATQSRLAGITPEEVCSLESQLLQALQWRMHVDDTHIRSLQMELKTHATRFRWIARKRASGLCRFLLPCAFLAAAALAARNARHISKR